MQFCFHLFDLGLDRFGVLIPDRRIVPAKEHNHGSDELEAEFAPGHSGTSHTIESQEEKVGISWLSKRNGVAVMQYSWEDYVQSPGDSCSHLQLPFQ